MLFGAKTLRGVFWIRKDMLKKALSVYHEYGLHPQIAQIFEWADAKAAFEALCNKSDVGKIVVRVGKD
jgi:NADPH:quinone reductase-like Zn-dependent oxidoreductase